MKILEKKGNYKYNRLELTDSGKIHFKQQNHIILKTYDLSLFISSNYGELNSIAGITVDGKDVGLCKGIESNTTDVEHIVKIYLEDDFSNMSKMFLKTNITEIDFSNMEDIQPETMNYVCSCSVKLKKVKGFNKINFLKLTTLESAFSGCTILSEIETKNLNLYALKSLSSIFYYTGLESIDMSGMYAPNLVYLASIGTLCNSLISADFSNITLDNALGVIALFLGCPNLKTLDVSNLKAPLATTIGHMADNCYNLEYCSLEGLQADSITLFQNMSQFTCKNVNMTNMYVPKLSGWFSYQNKTLETLDFTGTNIENVTCAEFSGCIALKSINISNLVNPNFKTFDRIFNGCTSLKEVIWNDIYDTYNLISLSQAFLLCSSLEQININFEKLDNLYYLDCIFYGCTFLKSFTISNWNPKDKILVASTFGNCTSLETFTMSNTTIQNMYDYVSWNSIFSNCNSLKTVSILNSTIKGVNNFTSMFSSRVSLQKVDLTGSSFPDVTNIQNLFNGCTNLIEVIMTGDVSNVTNVTDMFKGVTTTGTFYYNSTYDYSKIIEVLPSTWTAIPI